MANGILWQLVGNIDPLGRYNQGYNQHQQRDLQERNLLQQITQQQWQQDRDARNFGWQQQEAQRNQGNWEKQFAQNAQNQNAMRALQQQQLALQQAQFARGEIPAGFEKDPTNPGQIRPKVGGPADPNYIRSVTEAKPQKQVPFGVQNAEKEDLEAVQSFNTVNSELKRFQDLIAGGKLPLGPAANLRHRAFNTIGMSDEQSRNFNSFQATLERLRNESLRLNKGVQTEGDSQRAWNELVANINDPNVVMQRLQEIQRLNQRAADFKRNIVVQRREDNRLPALNIDRLLTPQSNQVQQQPNMPRAGEIRDGYRFRGGNPADQNAWEPVL